MGRIDARAVCARVNLAELIARHVQLRRAGQEFTGLCPFHAESTPSFTVHPGKGFFHCFGCGAHGDAIAFVMRITNVDFREAVRQLDSGAIEESRTFHVERPRQEYVPDTQWVPLLPVPDDAPDLMADAHWTVPIWNPKRGKATRLKLQRLDAYRNGRGELLGYVARAEIRDRDTRQAKKWTPQITWCVSPTGARQWCLQHFPEPRPLLGLDDLAAKPLAPVLIVEGEKCRAAGAGAWPQYAVVSWPGGTNGIGKVDWTPLSGRDVVVWPDADEVGNRAVTGFITDGGDVRLGIGHYLTQVGVRRLRIVDTEGRPKGWDVADALEKDCWSPQQAAAWVASRLCETLVRQ